MFFPSFYLLLFCFTLPLYQNIVLLYSTWNCIFLFDLSSFILLYIIFVTSACYITNCYFLLEIKPETKLQKYNDKLEHDLKKDLSKMILQLLSILSIILLQLLHL